MHSAILRELGMSLLWPQDGCSSSRHQGLARIHLKGEGGRETGRLAVMRGKGVVATNSCSHIFLSLLFPHFFTFWLPPNQRSPNPHCISTHPSGREHSIRTNWPTSSKLLNTAGPQLPHLRSEGRRLDALCM